MVDAVLLKPLPYPHPDRLVTVMEASAAKNQKESLIAPARLEGRRVSPRFFDVYGMKPLLGRTFSPDEDPFGGPASAVISQGLWKRIGKRLLAGGGAFTIGGVMPKEFSTSTNEVRLPAQVSSFLLKIREARFHIAQAQADPRAERIWAGSYREPARRSRWERFDSVSCSITARRRQLPARVAEKRIRLSEPVIAQTCAGLIGREWRHLNLERVRHADEIGDEIDRCPMAEVDGRPRTGSALCHRSAGAGGLSGQFRKARRLGVVNRVSVRRNPTVHGGSSVTELFS
jgi:hypothetical protein